MKSALLSLIVLFAGLANAQPRYNGILVLPVPAIKCDATGLDYNSPNIQPRFYIGAVFGETKELVTIVASEARVRELYQQCNIATVIALNSSNQILSINLNTGYVQPVSIPAGVMGTGGPGVNDE